MLKKYVSLLMLLGSTLFGAQNAFESLSQVYTLKPGAIIASNNFPQIVRLMQKDVNLHLDQRRTNSARPDLVTPTPVPDPAPSSTSGGQGTFHPFPELTPNLTSLSGSSSPSRSLASMIPRKSQAKLRPVSPRPDPVATTSTAKPSGSSSSGGGMSSVLAQMAARNKLPQGPDEGSKSDEKGQGLNPSDTGEGADLDEWE